MKKLILTSITLPLLLSCGNNNPKYTECECVDFFETHISSIYDISQSRTSEILECIKTYVYNEKEGRKNINPCFDKAWEDVKRIVDNTDVGFNFAVHAMDCDCK